MASFRTQHNLTNQGFCTIFKIQGQCYNKIGGLLQLLEEDPKFLEVYFMTNTDEEAKQWNRHIGGDLQIDVVTELKEMLHYNHTYDNIFEFAFGNIFQSDHNEKSRTDMKPPREHESHYITLFVDEVAIIPAASKQYALMT